MSGTGWIYAVHDDDGGVVYVGQTTETPAERYRGHLRDALSGSTTAFHGWLRARAEGGDVPRVSTLERPLLVNLSERELWWIRHYAEQRKDALLNTAGRSDLPGRALVDNARVRSLRSAVQAAIHTLGDGPFYGWQIRDEPGWSWTGPRYEDRLFDRLVEECLLAAGFLRRGDKYVRASSVPAQYTDPTIDIPTRITIMRNHRGLTGGIQAGHTAGKICVDLHSCEEALRQMGYAKMRSGWWRPVNKEASAHA